MRAPRRKYCGRCDSTKASPQFSKGSGWCRECVSSYSFRRANPAYSAVAVTVVCEAPSKRANGNGSFVGSARQRLRDLLPGARVVNLQGHWTKERMTPRTLQFAAEHLAPDLKGPVVLLGLRVATAFGLGGVSYFSRWRVNGVVFVVVPHPGHMNRWWNSPVNRVRARHHIVELVQS